MSRQRPVAIGALVCAVLAMAGAPAGAVGLASAAQTIQRRLPPIIQPRDAPKYLGREVIVEADVSQIVRAPTEGVTYLDLGGQFPHQQLRIVVPVRIQGQLDGAIWYVGRVRVRGVVQRGPDGHPRIVCAEAGQIVPVKPKP